MRRGNRRIGFGIASAALVGLLAGVGCMVPHAEVEASAPPDKATEFPVVPTPGATPAQPPPLPVVPPAGSDPGPVRPAMLEQPAEPPRRPRNVLALSGGGAYGAFTAGVLNGWSRSNTRPEFDVVTGISTGALIAPLAFLGPRYDCLLKESYTTITSDDVYEIRRPVRGLFAESVADNTPLRRMVERIISPQLMTEIAAEHQKGRRLYVGSTNLDTKQLVVWDVGAIAARGPEARGLVVEILMASSAIPGFFPPVRVPVEIAGRMYEELHVDGATTRALFFRAPHVPPSEREAFGAASLHDSNLYMLVAGKIYADPAGIRARTLAIAGASISSLLFAGTRGDLSRLYNFALLTGMNYYVAAIPQDLPVPAQATSFDPVEMGRLFNVGYQLAAEGVRKPAGPTPGPLGPAWRETPPGLAPGEETRSRTGLRQAVAPQTGTPRVPAEPAPPGSPSGAPPSGPRSFGGK